MSYKLAEDPFKRRFQTREIKKPLVLSKSEINRIISHAETPKNDYTYQSKLEEKKKEREAFSELTEAFSKKEEAGSELKKKHYAKDVEAVRVEEDRKARAEARKNDVLDKAYERLYKETDRVKYFNSAKNLCEITKQRQDQVDDKLTQLNRQAKSDAQYVLDLLRDADNYKCEEEDKAKISRDNKKKNAVTWSEQHKEVTHKKRQDKFESIRDGFLIKDEVEREQQKEEEKIEKIRLKNKLYKKSLDKQRNDKLMLLEMRQLLEDSEDAKARLFNEAKRDMEREHKDMKMEKDKKKQDRRQYVADNIVDEDSIRKRKEEFALLEAVLKAEDKRLEEETNKAQRQAEIQEAIEDFYEKEMALKQKKETEEKLSILRDRRNVDDLVEKLNEIEESKQRKRRQLENEVQHIQIHQMEARKNEGKSNETEALEEYLHHMRGLDQEEEMFQKYAQKQIEECEKRGVDTYAMRKAALPGIECGRGPLFKDRGYIRPRYYAVSWNKSDLPHMDRQSDKHNTKLRLGFGV